MERKKKLGVLLMLSMLLVASTSWASWLGTIADWQAAPSQTITLGGANFKYKNTSLATDTNVTLNDLPSGGLLTYSVVIGGSNKLLNGLFFDYTIALNGTYKFLTQQINSTATLPIESYSYALMQVNADTTIESVQAAPFGPVVITGNPSAITIHDTYVTGDGAQIDSVTNSFTTNQPEQPSSVPEPSTFALLGLGLGAMAFARKKMKR